MQHEPVMTREVLAAFQSLPSDAVVVDAEPTDFPFTPGSYRVDLLINGILVAGAQASFSIQG